jgi:ABC-type uncharacterized transport system substrate-binding protein
MTLRHILAAAALSSAVATGMIGPAQAHPHVYVTVETTVLYDKGVITGLRQRWAFDEFYTGMAIEGLDANGDGVLDRKELAELAKVNIDGLAQMNYFTTARLGEQQLAFDVPKEFWFDHVAMATPPGPQRQAALPAPGAAAAPAPSAPASPEPGFWSKLVKGLTGGDKPTEPDPSKVLVLDFVLPLKQPVLAEAKGFEYAVSDPQFWIWFNLDAGKGATIGPGAPAGCTASVGAPQGDAAEVERLGEAFFQQAGGAQFGLSVAKSVRVSCPKS